MDGDGLIARVWNHADHEVPLTIQLFGETVDTFRICDALEHPLTDWGKVTAAPKSVVTVLLHLSGQNGK